MESVAGHIAIDGEEWIAAGLPPVGQFRLIPIAVVLLSVLEMRSHSLVPPSAVLQGA